jgi:beta-glucosidase
MKVKYYLFLFIVLFASNIFSQEENQASIAKDKLNIEWWKDRHEEKIKPREAGPQLILLGNSIFHTLDYAKGVEVWNRYLNHFHALNLGFSGDRTENVIWRLENGEIDQMNPKLVLLLIGTNNTDGNHFLSITQPEALQNAIWKITRIIRKKLPKTKILILGIFPYGYKANYRDNLNKQTNKFLSEFPKKDKHIYYRDIGNIFLDEQGEIDKNLMPDYLHPNGKGHLLMFKTLDPFIEELMLD